jgi:hypothetical protein
VIKLELDEEALKQYGIVAPLGQSLDVSKQSAALSNSNVNQSVAINESKLEMSPIKIDDLNPLLPGEVIHPPPSVD